jgi:hypothetical protein
MTSLKDVLEKLAFSSSKRAERRPGHGFVAHHWCGSTARRDNIKDISSTGLYLLTEERWLPGTVVSLTLQMQSPVDEISERRITVHAKVIRWGEDGVGLSFVLPDAADAEPWRFLLQSAADQSEPNGVLDLARLAKAIEFLSRICPQAAEEVTRMVHGGLTKARVANAVEILLKTEALLSVDPGISESATKPHLVAKVLEYSSWAEEDWIQQMWAGLLASTCTTDGDDGSNESFIDLFSKLADVHVCIFTYACMRTTNLQATSGSTSSEPLICTREEIMEVTGSRELLRIERDLEHLYGLGLLEKSATAAANSTHYEVNITPSSLGMQLYARCTRPASHKNS